MFFFSRIAEAFKRRKRNKSFLSGATVFMGTPTGMVNLGTVTDVKMEIKKPVSDEEHVRKSLEEGTCPDCGCMKFLPGPCGGRSQNYMCADCGRRFNIAVMGDTLILAERI